jgi:hypothetical protein
VGPIRNNFGVIAKMLESFKTTDCISRRDRRRYRDISDTNGEVTRKLGPTYHAIMPYIEWDQQSARDFRAVFREQDGKPTHVTAEARLKDKIVMMERCAQSVEDLRERLLSKLEWINSTTQARGAGSGQVGEPLTDEHSVCCADGSADKLDLLNVPGQSVGPLRAQQVEPFSQNAQHERRQPLAASDESVFGEKFASEGNAQQWFTVSQAAQTAGCNKGVVSRAVEAGKLKSNGLERRERRIDTMALVPRP